jgi:hypothetical protein
MTKYAEWRPELLITAILKQVNVDVQVKWRMLDEAGKELDHPHARSDLKFPVIISKVVQ